MPTEIRPWNSNSPRFFFFPSFSGAPLTRHSPTGLSRQTLRSSKEFSAFDLALVRAWTTPVDFDFGVAIQERLADEDLTDDLDDDDEYGDAHDLDNAHDDLHDETPAHALSPSPSLPPVPLSSLSATARNKLKSRARRDKKR
ncbi:hypothetical protein B0H14DRAFT_3430320 [Mycena olivaceomarginata]|nr:hypothetical protein B0H14DRAFT_3430320 [Mycena olivaceomarginata]